MKWLAFCLQKFRVQIFGIVVLQRIVYVYIRYFCKFSSNDIDNISRIYEFPRIKQYVTYLSLKVYRVKYRWRVYLLVVRRAWALHSAFYSKSTKALERPEIMPCRCIRRKSMNVLRVRRAPDASLFFFFFCILGFERCRLRYTAYIVVSLHIHIIHTSTYICHFIIQKYSSYKYANKNWNWFQNNL